MNFNSEFQIKLTNRDDFEKILVQIHWRDIILCEIHKEYGEDNSEMKIRCNDFVYNDREIKFLFLDFLEAIKNAQEMLNRL